MIENIWIQASKDNLISYCLSMARNIWILFILQIFRSETCSGNSTPTSLWLGYHLLNWCPKLIFWNFLYLKLQYIRPAILFLSLKFGNLRLSWTKVRGSARNREIKKFKRTVSQNSVKKSIFMEREIKKTLKNLFSVENELVHKLIGTLFCCIIKFHFFDIFEISFSKNAHFYHTNVSCYQLFLAVFTR